MNSFKKLALAAALTAVAGVAMADDSVLHVNNETAYYTTAIVQNTPCIPILQPFTAPKTPDDQISWGTVTALCPSGQATCTADLYIMKSYPGTTKPTCSQFKQYSQTADKVGQATLYLQDVTDPKTQKVTPKGTIISTTSQETSSQPYYVVITP